ncbi:aspartate kinase [Acanthopleuribacter pedis]|uniref:Aspartokinase n=1 Tax=Acanthopleuribacter pedis TaxID=442870 RepID=A0A8J7Q654_9BACT|nr:aspartate kinase [Acanthopleuribacter pedis]MBO1318867.1 aspartate kinase [Acanthopleuribacter pedis]
MLESRKCVVYKFGGTSVAHPENLGRLVQLVHGEEHRCVLLVVSALAGVTNLLVEMGELLAAKHTPDQKAQLNHRLQAVEEKHLTLFTQCAQDAWLKIITTDFQTEFRALSAWIQELGKRNAAGSPAQAADIDQILFYGERFSSKFIHSLLLAHQPPGQAEINWVDARRLIATDERHGDASPLWARSRECIEHHLTPILAHSQVVITQGFTGANKDGRTTTLGRGGSDFSATFLAAALEADEAQIWSDVDGILTADPRTVDHVTTIHHLSYNQAESVARLGAKVLHPRCIAPVKKANIPLRVRNTARPEHPGTSINQSLPAERRTLITGKEEALLFHQERPLDQGVGWPSGEWQKLPSGHPPLAMSYAGHEWTIVSEDLPDWRHWWNHARHREAAAEAGRHRAPAGITPCAFIYVMCTRAGEASPTARALHILQNQTLLFHSRSADETSLALAVPRADFDSTVQLLHLALVQSEDPETEPLTAELSSV